MSRKRDEAANLERGGEPPGEQHLATIRLLRPKTVWTRARSAILSSSFRLTLVGTIALTVSCDAVDDGSGGSAAGADWVLTGGDIVTMDDANPSATAVAVADGEFTYVGDDAGAAAFVSDATRTVDLAGRLVFPGLIDGHTHPGYIDLEDYDGSVSGSSREEFLGIAAQPRRELSGGGVDPTLLLAQRGVRRRGHGAAPTRPRPHRRRPAAVDRQPFLAQLLAKLEGARGARGRRQHARSAARSRHVRPRRRRRPHRVGQGGGRLAAPGVAVRSRRRRARGQRRGLPADAVGERR